MRETRAAVLPLWSPRLPLHAGPRYRAIADAIEVDVREGRLNAGDPLPTQRALARQLGVDFTTVTRAYAEARRRGLITATVGRGTFVASVDTRTASGLARATNDHDLSVNAPPVPRWLPSALRTTMNRLAADATHTRNVLTYESRLGDTAACDAGASWLRARGLEPEAARIVVTAGAQHALMILLSTFGHAGDTVLTEALAYPGLQGAAALAGVRLVGVEMDDEGLRPDALHAACKKLKPAALFCVPTLQNPTTAVMSAARRREIVAVARRHALPIVEDDICGPLSPDSVPLAAIAPDLVVYIGSLSKCVAPGLRVAFVLLPTSDQATQLRAAVRSSLLMLSPLPLAIATAWIADGTAQRAVDDIRHEATARITLARRILGGAHVAAPAGSLHAWVRLPGSWTVAAFVAQAQQLGVRVAPADWYSVAAAVHDKRETTAAVRLTLGAEPDSAQLERALSILATILKQPVSLRTSNL